MKLGQQIPAINILNETNKPTVTPAPAVMTPQQLQKLSEIKTRAGWLSPSEVTSLAKGNATTQAIDAVATMKAKQIVDEQGSVIKIGIDIPVLLNELFAVPPEAADYVSVIVTASVTL